MSGIFGFAQHAYRDCRTAFRAFRRTPRLSAIVVLTIAFGLGVCIAILAVVYAVLLKPLPYPRAEQLKAIAFENGERFGYQFWPYPKFEVLRREQQVFSEVAGYAELPVTLRFGDQPKRAEAEIVTASYFQLLDLKLAIGRAFTADEDRTPGVHALSLVGYEVWQGLGGSPDILGSTMHINNRPFTIIGVLGPGFGGQSGNADVWLPVMMAEQVSAGRSLHQSNSWWLRAIGRLKDDMPESQVSGALSILTARLAELDPTPARAPQSKLGRLRAVSLRDTKIDPYVRRVFLILLAAAAAMLLAVCANAACLLLEWGTLRHQEFAVRLALGATPGHICRQVLTECLLLSAMGWVGAQLITTGAIAWLTAVKPWNVVGPGSRYAQTFDYFDIRIDSTMVILGLLTLIVTALIFGTAPAWQAFRVDVGPALKVGSVVAASFRSRGPGRHVRAALIVFQIGISFVLLTCAGLLLRTATSVSAIDIGFEPGRTFTMTLDIARRRGVQFYRDLLERMTAQSGVELAALGYTLPLTGRLSYAEFEIDSADGTPQVRRAGVTTVTPDYFKTLGVGVLDGRAFTDGDRIGAPFVAIVNRALADRTWPGAASVGRRIKIHLRVNYGPAETWHEVIGVVGDIKYEAVDQEREGMIYVSAWQPLGSADAVMLGPDSIFVRAKGDPHSTVPILHRVLRQLDDTVPVYDVMTLDERVSRATSRYRYAALLMTVFAVVTMVLSAAGIYGVVGQRAASRAQEIAIRLALGGQPGRVMRPIVGAGLMLAGTGIAMGLAAALITTRLIESMLFGVLPTDTFTLLGVTSIVAGVAALATALPARRAARIDPAVVLKTE
jgi:predicted permease